MSENMSFLCQKSSVGKDGKSIHKAENILPSQINSGLIIYKDSKQSIRNSTEKKIGNPPQVKYKWPINI